MPTVLVLLGADLRSFRNRLRRIERRRFTLICIGVPALAAGVLAPAVSLGVNLAPLGTHAAAGVFTLGFTSLGMVMMVIGLSTVMTSFFASRDLLLLAGAPIRLVDIYAARLLSAGRASLLIASLLLAAVTGYGVSIGAPPAYWIAAPLLTLCVVLATTAFQVMVLSLVVRIVPAARARMLVNVVAGLLGTGFWMAWLLLRGQDGGLSSNGDSLAQAAGNAASLGDRLAFVPTAWPARALAAFATNDSAALLWTLTTLLGTGALLLLGHTMFVGSFRRGLSALGEVARRGAPAASRRHAPAATAAPHALLQWNEPGQRPLLALVRKEWLLMRRDSRRLAVIIPLCIIAVLYPLIGPGSEKGVLDGFWPTVLRGGTISLMLPFFFTQILASPAVALEGRAFFLLRLAPVSPSALLYSKILATGVPMVAASAIAATVLGITHGGNLGQLAVLLLLATWLAMGATCIGVSGGALGARFDAEDPRRAVSTGAALGATVASLLFLGLSLLGAFEAAVATHAIARMPAIGGVGGGAGGGSLLASLLVFCMALGVEVLMIAMANRRLAEWQPDGSRAPLPAPVPAWAVPPGGSR